ncbi:DUF1697 domain-containing protein [Acuticoccus sp. M5D2P5]|uniref:DUF1697 domain-containing protein n=1 Tax=Acuticoccus kalidii TaxID=2910977 RepID=UPI001F371CB1|nr:DUF1697 domain-containing protein [Acuticoccus kalidii]MCF3936764.1 DUF1697 domain-containing protein [Acuticoccus kalidii]
MATYVGLLRGINVGGHRPLPMAALRALLGARGHEAVATYIQSGNAVFRTNRDDVDAMADEIAGDIEAAHGFRPEVIVRPLADLAAAIDGSPFAGADPGRVYCYILAGAPERPDLAALDAAAANGEAFHLGAGEGVFYLHAPAGIGRSKLAAMVERRLGVVTTTRSLKSVAAIVALGRKVAASGQPAGARLD